jgi:hypothetical protein
VVNLDVIARYVIALLGHDDNPPASSASS